MIADPPLPLARRRPRASTTASAITSSVECLLIYGSGIAQGSPRQVPAATVAALDPFSGYATAVATELPDATWVLDAFTS